MPNVTSFDISEWDKQDGNPPVKVSTVRFDDGQEVRGYDLPPGIENGKPLPEGWEIATSKAGKPYIKVPRKGGGGFGGGTPAFRNTKEGQAIEQDAMNRRTALMQAVTLIGEGTPWEQTAAAMYAWLTKDSTTQPAGHRDEGPSEQSPSGGEVGGVAGAVGEERAEALSGDCIHPVDNRRETPSGRIRCGVCSSFLD